MHVTMGEAHMLCGVWYVFDTSIFDSVVFLTQLMVFFIATYVFKLSGELRKFLYFVITYFCFLLFRFLTDSVNLLCKNWSILMFCSTSDFWMIQKVLRVSTS